MTATTKSSAWQHNLLKRMSDAKKQPYIMGGYAEDAVLYKKETRPHSDIDWMIPRSELDEYSNVARELGFPVQGTYGKTTSGEPFYVAWTADQSFWIECVLVDKDAAGNLYVELGELLFDTTGLPPFKPFKLFLPSDTFNYKKAKFEDFTIQTVSPLALYQLRTGLNVHKTFGELRDKDLVAMKALREKFFLDIPESELIPKIELL